MSYPLKFFSEERNENSFTDTKAVSDGYWVFLKPLGSGHHSIYFKGEKFAYDEVYKGKFNGNQPKFNVEVQYNIIIG